MPRADWSTKGLWLPDDGAVTGAKLFDGPFTWPVMVARRGAIEANIATMAAYCRRHGVDFAPHGKTTMAPTLFAAQLAAGAWGITVATANQALAARRFGVPRVLLANELVDPRVLAWAAAEAAAGWEFLHYVDSLAGAELLGDGARVFVEVGYAGGRTGVRTVAAAKAVAGAAAARGARVVGVAGFEGMLPDAAAVGDFLGVLVEAGRAVAPYCAERPIVSAGGSLYADTVVEALTAAARQEGWRVILRSGAVVTHDDGFYADGGPDLSLVGALEVWAQVLSTPEPGLAILGAGKRDVSFDLGLPVPRAARAPDGTERPLPGAAIDRLNDQHAFLLGADVAVGELVRLGISHPCTAFDKWRVIPVVDDTHTVVDLLHTYF